MGQQTLSYCTPVVLISLKFSSMRLTPGLSSHHYHPEFGETLQYDMANGLAIDFVRERKREWQMERKSKGNIWKGTGRKGVWRASGVRRYRRIVQGTHTILLKSTTVSGKWKREFLQDKYLKSAGPKKKKKSRMCLGTFFSLSLHVIKKTKCPFLSRLKGCSTLHRVRRWQLCSD